MSETLYMHCATGIREGTNCPLDVLVYEGNLMVICRVHRKPVHIQPFVGQPAVCGHCGTPAVEPHTH